MSTVDSTLYSNSTTPSKTRNASIPIQTFPLVKQQLTYNKIINPYFRVNNSQGYSSSSIRDADADAGKYYYIHMNPYDTSSNITRLLDNMCPILRNPSTFEVGSYYTYMIISVKAPSQPIANNETWSDPELYVTKTNSMFEFGTKHQQIMYRLAKQNEQIMSNNQRYRLYASGEIMCEDQNTLIFNFISGTYKMKRYISERRSKYEEAYIQYMMKTIAPRYTNIIFQKNVLITEDSVPLDKQYLSTLRRHNIPLFIFDTHDQCNKMKYKVIQKSVDKSLTNEEFQEIYRSIRNNV